MTTPRYATLRYLAVLSQPAACSDAVVPVSGVIYFSFVYSRQPRAAAGGQHGHIQMPRAS